MLYSEFLVGTKCADNAYNYDVYRNLEVMYMNTDMTKEQIYEYGVKLVNNEKTEKQIAIEVEVKAMIAKENEKLHDLIICQNHYVAVDDKEMIKYYRKLIKQTRNRIKDIKSILR